MAFHGFGGGSARETELAEPTMFHCLYCNDTIYYTMMSLKGFTSSSRQQFLKVERKLPPKEKALFLDKKSSSMDIFTRYIGRHFLYIGRDFLCIGRDFVVLLSTRDVHREARRIVVDSVLSKLARPSRLALSQKHTINISHTSHPETICRPHAAFNHHYKTKGKYATIFITTHPWNLHA
jgi:hypothetical protein